MDHSSIRLNFDHGKKNEIYQHGLKEHVKISKIAKFGCGMFSNTENIALRSLQILHKIILREKKCHHISQN